MSRPLYLTTTIPYVNAEPHIGFALEIVQADVLARFHRLEGREVFFSTGTDEYGQKIFQAAQAEGEGGQDYVDRYAARFDDLKKVLNLSYDNFIRTSSPGHITAAQEFWKLCDQNGDIYKKLYKGLYCVGCEKFLQARDLINGKCPLHPSSEPEEIEEENYFFRFSRYSDDLIKYLSNERAIVPEWRRQEALNLARELDDFSISRNRERLPWGVPVPGDESHVMYVWFGAFVNYISTLGWFHSAKASRDRPHSAKASRDKPSNLFEKFWQEGETIQMAGKDMVKFQSLMWQAMLMSASATLKKGGSPAIKNTDTIFYHGFIISGGTKMSKSLGNIINPLDLVCEYGTDAVRYFLLRHVHPVEDGDVTPESFKEIYNAHLANGLGNLVSRILKMAVTNDVVLPLSSEPNLSSANVSEGAKLDDFEFNKAMDNIWEGVCGLDEEIERTQPFKKIKIDSREARADILSLLTQLNQIAFRLQPFLPDTAAKIIDLITKHQVPDTPLFPRKD
ncbi:MAG: methionine--tRNA ligase [Patescibacteria group bacterium]|nr:methionine--tRNA ligase [Patescibacteria group bacterium]